MARPKKAPEDVRGKFLRLRFRDSERDEIKAAAERADQSMAVWARDHLLSLARQTSAATPAPVSNDLSAAAAATPTQTVMMIPSDLGTVEISVRVLPGDDR